MNTSKTSKGKDTIGRDVHVMKAYTGRRGVAPLSLNLGPRQR